MPRCWVEQDPNSTTNWTMTPNWITINKWLWRSPGSTTSRLKITEWKCPNNYRMDCHELWYRHSQIPTWHAAPSSFKLHFSPFKSGEFSLFVVLKTDFTCKGQFWVLLRPVKTSVQKFCGSGMTSLRSDIITLMMSSWCHRLSWVRLEASNIWQKAYVINTEVGKLWHFTTREGLVKEKLDSY